MIPAIETIPVSDHYLRAIHFLDQSRRASDLNGFNWNILASIYSARAIVEVIYDHFKRDFASQDADAFLEEARNSVRRFRLIESIRVQDFHRRAIRFAPNMFSMAGPITTKTGTQRGSLAGLSVDPATGKITEHKLRNASVKYDRPVAINGLTAHDSEADEYVQIDIAVEQYLNDLREHLVKHYTFFEMWLPKLIVQNESSPQPPA